MEDLAQSAMDAVSDGRVKIIPARYAKGYLDWLGEKRDWPVSRQLWWGHQIPIWYAHRRERSRSEARFRRPRRRRLATRSGARPLADLCRGKRTWPKTPLPGHKLSRDPDVLDTWFSSALWPHSTLGWPEQTPELAYYYPTSALVTSRDIITLWVARMVLTGLHNVGDVPFREVFIHPKILDGYGESMSKSKGNGVDPIDVMDKFGADCPALRAGLPDDRNARRAHAGRVRMPALPDADRANEEEPRAAAGEVQAMRPGVLHAMGRQAGRRGPAARRRGQRAVRAGPQLLQQALERRAVRADESRRLHAGPVADAELVVEDRWILSRLATVTERSDRGAWTSIALPTRTRCCTISPGTSSAVFTWRWSRAGCKIRPSRPTAQRVLAHTLDTLLRLLHPLIPFITEEIWQLLNEAAPQRGLPAPARPAESIMIAPWPDGRRAAPGSADRSPLRAVPGSAGGPARDSQPAEHAAATEIEFSLRCDADGRAVAADGRLISSRWPGPWRPPGDRMSRRPRPAPTPCCGRASSSSTWPD